MGINHEVDDFISGRALETVAEPVNCHLGVAHGVKHEILQFEQGDLFSVEGSEWCVCHVPIISTGSGSSLVLVCHFGNWSEAADLGINQR